MNYSKSQDYKLGRKNKQSFVEKHWKKKTKQEKYEEKGNADGLILNCEVHENELWKNIDW